ETAAPCHEAVGQQRRYECALTRRLLDEIVECVARERPRELLAQLLEQAPRRFAGAWEQARAEGAAAAAAAAGSFAAAGGTATGTAAIVATPRDALVCYGSGASGEGAAALAARRAAAAAAAAAAGAQLPQAAAAAAKLPEAAARRRC